MNEYHSTGVVTKSHHLFAVALILIMALLLFSSAAHHSPTIDEPVLMTVGLAYWWTGDTRLNFTHPPLAHMLATLPIALTEPKIDFRKFERWDTGSYFRVTRDYLKKHYAVARAQIMKARKTIVVLTLLLAAYIYFWCLRVYGPPTALAALFFFTFNPMVLAHGSLVTSDLAVTCFMTVALGEFYFCLRKPGLFHLMTTTLAFACAVLSKYSAVLLLPVMIGTAAVFAWKGWGRFESKQRIYRFGLLILECLVALVLVLLCINGAYRFQNTGWSAEKILTHPQPTDSLARGMQDTLLEMETPLTLLPSWTPIPVPYEFIYGLASQRKHNRDGHPTYFMGRTRTQGLFYYYPVMLAIKTPAGLLVLLGFAFALAMKRRIKPTTATNLLILAALFYLLVFMASNINIGVRYALPVEVLMIILAGRSAVWIWGADGSHRLFRALVAVLSVSVMVAVLAVSPHYLGYFNLFVGGEKTGHKVSIIGEDWGQDVAELAEIVKCGHPPRMYYDDFTYQQMLEMIYAGVKSHKYRCNKKISRPAWVAVHAMKVLRAPNLDECYAFMKNREPDININHHIWLYKLD